MKNHTKRTVIKPASKPYSYKELRDIHALDERRLDNPLHRSPQPIDKIDRLVNIAWLLVPALLAALICYYADNLG